MRLRILSFLMIIVLCLNVAFYPLSLRCQEITYSEENNLEQTIPTVNKFLFNIQKYTGINFLVDFLAEAIVKAIIKLKTSAKNISVDLQIYNGFDLFRKKAKSLEIKADDLYVKDIPIERFELATNGPIYFKKALISGKRKSKTVYPLEINSKIKINLNNLSEVLNNLEKWKRVFKKTELPIPPFGSTEVSINDLKININEEGIVQASSVIKSVINPQAEPLKLSFIGKLNVVNERLIIDDLESEIEDIFTKDSDMAKSFSEFLEDLINPIFNFHKYEKKGLKIDSVKLSYGLNSLIVEIKLKLMPPQKKNEEYKQ